MKSQWNEDLYFAVKFAQQKLSKYYGEVTPMLCMLLISAHIPHSFRKLLTAMMWDNGMDINSADETSYSTKYQETFLKYIENEYCANHRHWPIIKPESILSINLFPYAMG